MELGKGNVLLFRSFSVFWIEILFFFFSFQFFNRTIQLDMHSEI